MAAAAEVPKLGNTVEECLIATWRKRKGDRVTAGEVVAEIETDKATFEVTSPVSGTLLETFFGEGALAPVFANLFVVGEPGEDVESFRPGAPAQPAPAREVAAPAVESVRIETPHEEPNGRWSPRARRFAREHHLEPAGVSGSGPGGRVLEDDVRRLYLSSPRISALARQQIEAGAAVSGDGSGPGGMVLGADLGAPAERIGSIRQKIARRMRESLATTAQYTLHTSANAGGLLTLRARIKASPGVPDININDLVTFCTILALRDMPELNAEFVEGAIQRRAEIHIGFAADTPRGLMVPVLRDAHKLSLGDLALKTKELAAQAAAGTICVEDLRGATFTISNLGSLGIESFTPILNPPQVAILGVDAIQLKPVRRDGRVEFIDAIGLSLTCDHQVIDGAPGARFLKILREKIENVEALCTI